MSETDEALADIDRCDIPEGTGLVALAEEIRWLRTEREQLSRKWIDAQEYANKMEHENAILGVKYTCDMRVAEAKMERMREKMARLLKRAGERHRDKPTGCCCGGGQFCCLYGFCNEMRDYLDEFQMAAK